MRTRNRRVSRALLAVSALIIGVLQHPSAVFAQSPGRDGSPGASAAAPDPGTGQGGAEDSPPDAAAPNAPEPCDGFCVVRRSAFDDHTHEDPAPESAHGESVEEQAEPQPPIAPPHSDCRAAHCLPTPIPTPDPTPHPEPIQKPTALVCGNAIALLGTASATCPTTPAPVSICGNAIAILGTAVATCSQTPPEQGISICGNAIAVLGTATATCQKTPTNRTNHTAEPDKPTPTPPSRTPQASTQRSTTPQTATPQSIHEPWKTPARPPLYGRHSGWTPPSPTPPTDPRDRQVWVMSPIGGALPIPGTARDLVPVNPPR
ncbi:hypothetical protein [Actinocorallia sp. A-T 12471]|uniref:hypothetical protein n=1 Tax=Actinocorallia sp. A-T 12471 TaxID=3089813 RepID=UPI0029D381A5|nr:hypothetical protein [Actinocorallia sp. A-T 12471]MDX6742456.1 hypothetical protein [Actinocorallia sp. A-T 12471]